LRFQWNAWRKKKKKTVIEKGSRGFAEGFAIRENKLYHSLKQVLSDIWQSGKKKEKKKNRNTRSIVPVHNNRRSQFYSMEKCSGARANCHAILCHTAAVLEIGSTMRRLNHFQA